MNNDNAKSINEFDFNLICEYFSSIERQGPGSDEMTQKALSFIRHLDENPRIADIGCGTDSQIFVLAENLPSSRLYSLGLFPLFLQKLKSRVFSEHISERVNCIECSIDNLPFPEKWFDVICRERAIYNIGFERGLKYWRKFLKEGDYVVVSESSWFTDSRPKEIEQKETAMRKLSDEGEV